MGQQPETRKQRDKHLGCGLFYGFQNAKARKRENQENTKMAEIVKKNWIIIDNKMVDYRG